MESLIIEARELKECLKAGFYERAYELAQNIDDELTTMEIKKPFASHQAFERLRINKQTLIIIIY